MEEKKVINKRNVIIAIALFVLLVLYLIFFTSLFNKPLSSEEAVEKSAIIGYDVDEDDVGFLDSFFDPKTAKGWRQAPYTTVNSYYQYKRILKKLDESEHSYAAEMKVVLENFGYERDFFRKHSLLLIEGPVNRYDWISEVNTSIGEIEVVIWCSKWESHGFNPNYYGTGSDTRLYIVPVLKKSLWTADITVDFRRDWAAA